MAIVHHLKDETGNRHRKLTVIKRMPNLLHLDGSRWLCRCDCGTEIIATGGNLRSGHTSSCGAKGCRRTRNSYREEVKPMKRAFPVYIQTEEEMLALIRAGVKKASPEEERSAKIRECFHALKMLETTVDRRNKFYWRAKFDKLNKELNG